MQKKKVLVMSTLLVAVVLLSIGTIAYFRRTVNGNITGNTGNLVLIVNEANAVDNETFTITLQRSEEETFILPDDSGSFDLNIDTTGSTTDVAVNILISRVNLPNNLKFYLDSNHTQELTTYGTVIKKADTMTKTVPVYWFWDGSVSDEDDSEFINQTISANISVTATITKTFYETLLTKEHTLDTNVDFSQGASEANGQGLMMMNSTQNDEYPIVYYRGDVNNNNVIYAGYCWLIVRTTETGGVKLIYNGEVNSDGSCNNYSGVDNATANTDRLGAYANRIETYYNNVGYTPVSPVYVGYMYNDTNKYLSGSYPNYMLETDADEYNAYLEDNTIDSETGLHTQNLKDSSIKEIVDGWYEANIKGKAEESLLEDTVWCNDRSVTSEKYSIENMANGTNTGFNFAAYTRLYENRSTTGITPSLECSRDMDKFTVESSNGNGDLTYPIGLLTVDESVLAGLIEAESGPSSETITNYLNISGAIGQFWTMSPWNFSYGNISVVSLIKSGIFPTGFDNNSDFGYAGVRPAISLGNKTFIISGNGSFETPYTVG